jgi:hypothetical protein
MGSLELALELALWIWRSSPASPPWAPSAAELERGCENSINPAKSGRWRTGYSARGMRLSHRTTSFAARAAVLLAVLLCAAAARHALRALPGAVEDGALGLRMNLAFVGRLELLALGDDGEGLCDGPLAGLGQRWRVTLPGLRVEGPRAAPANGLAARIVVGDLDEPEVARLLAAARLPLRFGEQGTPYIGEHAFAPATFALACTFADPDRAGLPLTVVAGPPRSLARALEVLAPNCRPMCVVWSDGERVLELDLGPRGGARLQSARILDSPGAPANEADAARLAGVLDSRLPVALATLERSFGRSFAGRSLPELVGLRSVERLLRSGTEDVGAVFDRFHGRLSALVGPEHEHDLVAALVAGWLVEELGAPADPWLADGVAIACVDGLAGESLETWGARLCEGDPAPVDLATVLEQLLPERPPGTDTSRWSGTLERRVRCGLVARALLGALDAAALVRAWELGLAALAPAQRQAFEAECTRLVRALPAPAAASTADPLPARFGGVTLTAPARPDQAGHGTATAFDALDRLAELGARVALVTVHVVVSRTGEVVRSLEGDAALVATLVGLRSRGIVSVLAVQPITGEHGNGPIDHPKLGSPANWRFAVERQAAAVRHAACLARWGQADALCIARGALQFFAVPWGGAGAEPAGHAAVRQEKERGWQLLVDAGRIAGVPLVALAPQSGLAADVPVRAALAWVGADVAPRFVGDGALAPGVGTALAELVGAQLALGEEVLVIGFAAASNVAFGMDRIGGHADREQQRAYLEALATAAAGPDAPPRVFLRSWDLDGRSLERDEDVARRAELDAVLRRWFAR